MFIEDWSGRSIRVEASHGGVLATADFANNLLPMGDCIPPFLIQKLFDAKRDHCFEPSAQRVLTEKLGFYSDLQSINSEDAITASYFGLLAMASPETQTRFSNWLLERLNLSVRNSTCIVDLWRRVPHPQSDGMGGPELDFILSGDRCQLVGETKWGSSEGRGQGIYKDKGQLELRVDYLQGLARRMAPCTAKVLLCIFESPNSFPNRPPSTSEVLVEFMTWTDLAEFEEHPRAAEFSRYLAWKRQHLRRRRPTSEPSASRVQRRVHDEVRT